MGLVRYGFLVVFFFFKQKTAYEMRISDWSADVCSSDLRFHTFARALADRWRVQDPGRIRYRMEWPRWRPAPIDADGAADGTARVGRRDEPAARIRVDPGARRRRSGATLLLGGCRRRVPSPSGAHLWLRDRRHAPEQPEIDPGHGHRPQLKTEKRQV